MGISPCCRKEKSKGKLFFNNGDYYIGEIIDSKANGKGSLYYKNGTIKYIGDFVDGKKEGFGKYYFDDKNWFVMENGKKFYFIIGDYYTGQWKNDSMNGKGTIYLKDGSIKYEGDFVNNKITGYGKYYFENGVYYLGQWLDDKQHGKGKIFDKNGNIVLEGDFVNDQLDGYGKIYLSNGNYFIGQFKQGILQGKGKEYDKNGNFFFENEYFKDKKDNYYIDGINDITNDKGPTHLNYGFPNNELNFFDGKMLNMETK